MAPVLTITDVTYIAATTSALPSDPSIKVNAMKAQWVLVPLLQHLLLFEGDHLPPFDAILRSLRSSLATTLATHAPLASKLHFLADTSDVSIYCSTGGGGDDGVKFIATECDADVQATCLAGGRVAIGVSVHHAVADGPSL